MPRLREQIKETIEDNKFSLGNVVRLKSGGPQMTVMEVDGTQVTCTWYREFYVSDDPGHFPQQIFDEEVIELSPASTAV